MGSDSFEPAVGRIRFLEVGKTYADDRRALSDLTFLIDRGEIVGLTGPSGAGKTTLLRLIYRAELPSAGTILVNGRNVAALPRRKVPFLRRTLGVVFQDSRLIERKTVLENVAYLPRLLGLPARERKARALAALDRVALADRGDAFPRELSGGEQQRVAIARAMVNEPAVILADEPTGNLDPALSNEILDLLHDAHAAGTTVVVASHDEAVLARLGGRVLSLEGGRLVADGPWARRQARGPEAIGS